MSGPLRPTWAEVDLGAIRHNVERLREVVAPAELCAVVKADGYGHGAVPVARAVLDAGAAWLGVALVEEGEELRAAGIDAPILVMAEPPIAAVSRLLAAGLVPALYTLALGTALDAAGRARGEPVPIHVKADTGMARVGVPEPEWEALLGQAAAWQGVTVEAVWTHLACADEPDRRTSQDQLEAFDRFRATARRAGLAPRLAHAANSAAGLLLPAARLDLVRAGIAVYGLSPAPDLRAADHGLLQALRLVTEVAYVKRVEAGTPVSYGHRWEAPEDGWLATLPIGYADGMPRLLTNRAEVLIGGLRRPVAGTVCMDQVLVWCGSDEVWPGDEAVLLGNQGSDAIAADEWAEHAATIAYEIATGIGSRVPRRYVES